MHELQHNLQLKQGLLALAVASTNTPLIPNVETAQTDFSGPTYNKKNNGIKRAKRLMQKKKRKQGAKQRRRK